MSLKTYLRNEFLRDLKKLEFQIPNSVILNNPELFRIDRNTIYFGGPEWRNITNDVQYIMNKDYFFLCLFTITVIDLTMYTYYQEYYIDFRKLTMYPKFGWSGFGPHYENPKKLLLIPERKNFLDRDNVAQHIDDYVNLFWDECESFFSTKIPEISTHDFINKILNDEDFQINCKDSNSVFEMVYIKLREKISIDP